MNPKYLYSKELPEVYALKKSKVIVAKIPQQNIIAFEGIGAPELSEDFSTGIKLLYAMAFKLKYATKSIQEQDYTLYPMEGLWWTDDPNLDFLAHDTRPFWRWKISIPYPDFVLPETIEKSKEKFLTKIKADGLESQSDKLTFEVRPAHEVIQTLHLGSYEKEKPTIHNIFYYAKENGLIINGKHQEIYLNEPSKTKTENLKTIIRYGIEPSNNKTLIDVVYIRENIILLKQEKGLSPAEIAQRLEVDLDYVLKVVSETEIWV